MQHISVENFWTIGSDTRSLTHASVVANSRFATPGTFMESFAITRACTFLKVSAHFAVLVVGCHE